MTSAGELRPLRWEGGGGALKDFLEYMKVVSDGASAKKIQELKDLTRRRQPIDPKRGPIEDAILKLLVYGDQQVPGTQIKIGVIRRSLRDFVRRQKEGVKFAHKNYMRKKTKFEKLPKTCVCVINRVPV